MSSSTSSSSSFLARGLVWLAVMLGLPLLGGRVIAARYQPRPLGPSAAEVEASRHTVLVFGNSHTEAAIDPKALAEALSTNEGRAEVRAYAGGGWNALHSYMLALLDRDRLRPGWDAVVIETSPFTLDDDVEKQSRLGAIRPEVAAPMIAVPGLPVELRLDVAVGALSGLYRYRTALHAELLQPRLERIADRVGRPLLGEPRWRPGYQLITEPGRDFVVAEIRGHAAEFRAARRADFQRTLPRLHVGGFQLVALRRAVEALRERGIAVYLLHVPNSAWLTERLAATEAQRRWAQEIDRLGADTGAVVLRHWPAAMSDDDLYWDYVHMRAAAAGPFTAALARRIGADFQQSVHPRQTLRWPR